MPDEIAERVISVLATAKRIPREQLSLDSSLQALGFDSLDTINLLFDLEEQFQISIPDQEARSIRTVGEIVEGIRRLKQKSTDAVAPAPE